MKVGDKVRVIAAGDFARIWDEQKRVDRLLEVGEIVTISRIIDDGVRSRVIYEYRTKEGTIDSQFLSRSKIELLPTDDFEGWEEL